MNARDKGILSALLKIARVCGTFPSEEPSKCFYIYQCLLFIWNLSYTVLGIWYNADVYEMKEVKALAGYLTSFLVAMQGLSFQLMCLCYPEHWRKFYVNLQTHHDKTPIKKRYVFMEVLILYIIICIRIFLVLWTWIKIVGIQILAGYSFRHFNDCYTMVSVLILVHINMVIKRKFLLINKTLRHSHCIRYAQEVYCGTIKLIQDFSHIFGYQIIIVIANTISILLENLHYVLWYFDYSRDDSIRVLFWYSFYTITLVVIKPLYQGKQL